MEAVLLAFGLAAGITLLSGPFFIPILHRLKFGQNVRHDGPRSHLKKAGTPTMGGLMFLAGIIVAVLVTGGGKPETWVLMLVTLCYGILGFTDDFIKVVKKRSLGLRAKEKILGQTVIALILAVAAAYLLKLGTGIRIPYVGIVVDYGFLVYFAFIWVVTVGTSNSVNLTDGLDGLAAGITVIVSLTFTLIAIMMALWPVAVFGAAMAGGCLAFLRFNAHPAKVFMGDTGSLALGGGLAAMAVLSKTELLLPIIGGVYAAETLSVIIQVISFQSTGKRAFRMAPLHHHFELGGWSERKVVRNFWLASVICALVGLMGLYNIG
ncbi:MAG TPA: phospho-N-acetylmuramoyl-pentapeptide-transferase [Bacillota bacterium]|nr:phospho-N-acetylmuramoyl-pentapeptide-transferase [Bacillota bacterium]